MSKDKFKLEILYDDMSTEIKYFPTRQAADWYARTEGDHVWEYKVKETDNNE